MNGLFWQDSGPAVTRLMPPIPETGWRTPRDFPNLAAAKALAIDCETYDPELLDHGPGWARGRGHIVGISVGTDDGYRAYFPMRHTVEPEYNLPPDKVLAWAAVELARPTQPKLGANLIYDVGWLRQEGVRVAGELFDVEFAEALLDEAATVNLGDLGTRYLGIGKTSAQLYDWCRAWYGGGEDQRANIWRAPPRLVGPYAEGDVDLPFRVLDKQWQRLQAEGLIDLFRMECALIPLLVEMRFAGVSVDLAHAEQVRADLLAASIEEQAKLRSIVGFEINVNAAASIAKAFDKFGYSYERTPKGAPSFDKDFLTGCKNPVADAIDEIRKLDKLRTTFVENYILGAHVNGKVYCSFNPLRADETGTRSGRFSSNDPNLQNIPVRDKVWGKKLRSLFTIDSGHKQWRKFDYSQIEYRFLVHFAVGPGADEARQKYITDPSTDYHAWVQQLVAPVAGWDLSTAELRKLHRFLTKNLNFGAVYGIGEGHMAELLQKPRSEAKQILNSYHEALPFVRATMQACIRQIEQQGYISTILGRRSRFDLWESAQQRGTLPLPYQQALLAYGQIKRAYAYRSLNRRLQGSAADLFKRAMLQCWQSGVYSYTGVPRLIVHDEEDFSDAGGTDEAFAEMKRVMETALVLRVPVMAEEERGANWGQLTGV
jgi:DNA polymerase I-like protein with 3'-5' exonuclease and polymerase domains